MRSSFDLDKHLKEEHHISPLSTYLKEIVYGGNDGIITTFAIVAGFTGANTSATNLPITAVLLFGFANLFADGISMGLGNFLSMRSEKDVYKNFKTQEHHEIKHNPESEKRESLEILKRKGFSETQARKLVEIYATNTRYWLEFMMDDELELPDPEKENPFLTSITTFLAFVGFGLIPLLPYLFARKSSNVFLYSVIATGIALLVLGVLRAKVTHRSLTIPLLETLILGGSAAGIAYIVGTMFKI